MRVRKSPFNALIKRAIDGQLTGSNAAPDFNCAAYFAYNFSQGIVYRACSRIAGRQLGGGGGVIWSDMSRKGIYCAAFSTTFTILSLSLSLVAVYPMATSM